MNKIENNSKIHIIEIIAYIVLLTFGIFCFNTFDNNTYKHNQEIIRNNDLHKFIIKKAYNNADYYMQISDYEVIVTDDNNKIMYKFDSSSQIFKILEQDNK